MLLFANSKNIAMKHSYDHVKLLCILCLCVFNSGFLESSPPTAKYIPWKIRRPFPLSNSRLSRRLLSDLVSEFECVSQETSLDVSPVPSVACRWCISLFGVSVHSLKHHGLCTEHWADPPVHLETPQGAQDPHPAETRFTCRLLFIPAKVVVLGP